MFFNRESWRCAGNVGTHLGTSAGWAMWPLDMGGEMVPCTTYIFPVGSAKAKVLQLQCQMCLYVFVASWIWIHTTLQAAEKQAVKDENAAQSDYETLAKETTASVATKKKEAWIWDTNIHQHPSTQCPRVLPITTRFAESTLLRLTVWRQPSPKPRCHFPTSES